MIDRIRYRKAREFQSIWSPAPKLLSLLSLADLKTARYLAAAILLPFRALATPRTARKARCGVIGCPRAADRPTG